MPMMLMMSCQPSILFAVMRALRASHGIRTLPFHTPPEQKLALAWLGLLVGIVVLALQGASIPWLSSERPCMIAYDPGNSPWVMRLEGQCGGP
jgi:hypothetical protein